MTLLLLDTRVLLWASGEPAKLSAPASAPREPRNTLAFSVASLREIMIKRGLGRDEVRVERRRLRRGLIDAGDRDCDRDRDEPTAGAA